MCVNSSTGAILARTKCTKAEVRLSETTLNNLVDKPAFNPLTCYWRLGSSTDLTGAARQVAMTTMCDVNDVAVSHSIEHNDQNLVVDISSIAFKTITGASHSLPQGVEYRVNVTSSIPPGENIKGEVDLLCCKYPAA